MDGCIRKLRQVVAREVCSCVAWSVPKGHEGLRDVCKQQRVAQGKCLCTELGEN